jgi:acyl carrier protein
VAASADEVRAGLAEILNEVADVDASDVTDDKSFTDDLDVDSLSMVEVAMAAEEKFGVKIPDDDLPKLRTVGDAVNYIQTNGRALTDRSSTVPHIARRTSP